MTFFNRLKNSVLPFFKSWFILATVIVLGVIILKSSNAEVSNTNIVDAKPVVDAKPAVVVVYEKQSQVEDYLLAHETLKCYCQIYGYKFFLIVMENSPEMKILCPQKHIWFQRICVPMRILQQNPDIKFVFFLDADVGVINPKHRLEEYINPKFDLSFYERAFNYDIMTGGFIIKNTRFSIQFIEDWMKYEDRFTVEYGNNDQAAVHQMFLDRFYPNHPRKQKCENIWATADNNTAEGHTNFVGCVRSILNDKLEFDNVIIYPKGSHRAWSRDIWLTKGKWAPRDFLLHDMDHFKMTNDPEGLKDFMYFPNPFLADAVFHSSLCTWPTGLNCWKYNSTSMTTDEKVDELILKKAKESRQRYLDFIKTL